MASLTSKVFRNVGSRVAAQWSDLNTPLTILNGTGQNWMGDGVNFVMVGSTDKASYITAGGEQLTIGLRKAPSPAAIVSATITLAANANLTALVADINAKVAAIDGAFVGALKPAYELSDSMSGPALVISNPWYVRTRIVGGNYAAKRLIFEKVGLPDDEIRDIVAAAVTLKTGLLGGPPSLTNWTFSDEIAVPDGANAVALNVAGVAIDDQSGRQFAPMLFVAWSNGVDGVVDPLNRSLILTNVECTMTASAPASGIGIVSADAMALNPHKAPLGGTGPTGLFNLTIPPGMTGVRILIGPMHTAAIADVPMTAPKMSVAVTFGAR